MMQCCSHLAMWKLVTLVVGNRDGYKAEAEASPCNDMLQITSVDMAHTETLTRTHTSITTLVFDGWGFTPAVILPNIIFFKIITSAVHCCGTQWCGHGQEIVILVSKDLRHAMRCMLPACPRKALTILQRDVSLAKRQDVARSYTSKDGSSLSFSFAANCGTLSSYHIISYDIICIIQPILWSHGFW